MSKWDWHVSPDVLALTLLSVAPGFSGSAGQSDIQSAGDDPKPLFETVALSFIAAAVTKSYWPIVGAAGYLAYDHFYYTRIFDKVKGGVPNGGSILGNVESVNY